MSAPPLGITARAIVDRVVDGDTIELRLMLPVTVRMLNCWAPEIHGSEKPDGLKSKAQLEKMAPVGSEVVIHVPTGQADALSGVLTFGRVLGEVYRKGDSESLSELMVAAGMATREKVK